MSGPRLIVLGRQGAGKGTQCARLASHLAVPHVSTGDLFRDAIAAGTALGAQARSFVERGALVPDDIVLDLVAAQLGATSTISWSPSTAPDHPTTSSSGCARRSSLGSEPRATSEREPCGARAPDLRSR